MADPQVNFFKSTLVGTYSDADTSITIATGDGALLPDPSTEGAFNLTIFEGLQVTGSTTFEIVRVTARSGDVLTVTRGQESTTPLTIGSATHSILMSATKKTFDDINTAIANVNVTNLTGVEELTFDSTGDEEFGLPAGTTAQRPSSPSAGYMRWNSTDSRIEFYNGSRWAGLSEIGFQSETMEVAQASATANDAVAENAPIEVEYLVIAGGGGGGYRGNRGGGGGGAGGYRSSVGGESSGGGASAESPLELDLSTNYTVTVGAGGAGSTAFQVQNQGNDSVFSTITAIKGGAGGSGADDSTRDGGSGGGSDGANQYGAGSGTVSQGFNGGTGINIDPNGSGGGGGGASEVGADATTTIGGDGGDGVSSSIAGSAITRAGGGGGGTRSGTVGTGGLGGGGNGGVNTSNGTSATANTGSGGGGGGGAADPSPGAGDGGNGGSGVVILRYPSDYTISIGAGLTGSETTVGANKVATITAGTGNVSWTTA